MLELIRELQTQDHFKPLKVERNAGKILESLNVYEADEEEIFKAADATELKGRADKVYQTKKKAFQDYAKDWKVTALTVNHPLRREGVDVEDYNTGMYDWWKNNRWNKKGISKVDADWQYITFFFDTPKTHEEAVTLVRSFIEDWAYKPASQDKQISVDDAVVLDRVGRNYWDRGDNGRVKKIDGNNILVRFHHHGNIVLDASKFIYDTENNSWNVTTDADFQKAVTSKKGNPKSGDEVLVKLPSEEIIQQGKVLRLDGDKVWVNYRPPVANWGDPPKPEKVVIIPVADLDYSGKDKNWAQRGARDE